MKASTTTRDEAADEPQMDTDDGQSVPMAAYNKVLEEEDVCNDTCVCQGVSACNVIFVSVCAGGSCMGCMVVECRN